MLPGDKIDLGWYFCLFPFSRKDQPWSLTQGGCEIQLSDHPKLVERVTKTIIVMASSSFPITRTTICLDLSKIVSPYQRQPRRCHHTDWCVWCEGNRFPPSGAAFGRKRCSPSVLNIEIVLDLNIWKMFHQVVTLDWRQTWKCPGCWEDIPAMIPESESDWKKTQRKGTKWTPRREIFKRANFKCVLNSPRSLSTSIVSRTYPQGRERGKP